jgi:hypothetical protein
VSHVPNEFIRKHAPVLTTALTLLSYAVRVIPFVGTVAGTLASDIGSAMGVAVEKAEQVVDVLDSMRTFVEQVAETSPGGTSGEDAAATAAGAPVKDPEAQSKAFGRWLDEQDGTERAGRSPYCGLTRVVLRKPESHATASGTINERSIGSVVWLCKHHSNEYVTEGRAEAWTDQMRVVGTKKEKARQAQATSVAFQIRTT